MGCSLMLVVLGLGDEEDFSHGCFGRTRLEKEVASGALALRGWQEESIRGVLLLTRTEIQLH